MQQVTTQAETSQEAMPTGDPRTIRLKYPVEMGQGERARKLTEIRIPEIHEVESWVFIEGEELAQRNGQSVVFTILANITGEPYALVRKIKLPDLHRIRPLMDEFQDAGNAMT